MALAIHEQARRRECHERGRVTHPSRARRRLQRRNRRRTWTHRRWSRWIVRASRRDGQWCTRRRGRFPRRSGHQADDLFGRCTGSGRSATMARAEDLAEVTTPARQTALDAYLESAVKAVATLTVSAPSARDVVLSGRLSRVAAIREALVRPTVAGHARRNGGFALGLCYCCQARRAGSRSTGRWPCRRKLGITRRATRYPTTRAAQCSTIYT